MEVYLDLAIGLNFLVDWLLLLGTNRLSGFALKPGRCAAGAALGAVYGGVCLLPDFRFLGSSLWRLVFLGLMAAVAFGTGPAAVKRGGVFVLLSMALGGVALNIRRGGFGTLVLCAGGMWLLCRLIFGSGIGAQEYVQVELHWQGRSQKLLALRDTGNTLRDPITGQPVLVVSAQVGQQLTGLSREHLAHPLETLTKRPLPGLRLIPYRAVGQAGGMLLGLPLKQVSIDGRQTSAVVAFAPEGLEEGSYQALVTGGAL